MKTKETSSKNSGDSTASAEFPSDPDKEEEVGEEIISLEEKKKVGTFFPFKISIPSLPSIFLPKNSFFSPKELEDQLARKYPTEKRIFDFLESITVMVSILSLVIVAVALTVYIVVADYNDYPGSTLYNIGRLPPHPS